MKNMPSPLLIHCARASANGFEVAIFVGSSERDRSIRQVREKEWV